jgi:hypothetical protein
MIPIALEVSKHLPDLLDLKFHVFYFLPHLVCLLGVFVKEHIRIYHFVKWEVVLTLDDLVLILAEFHSFEGEKQDLGLA